MEIDANWKFVGPNANSVKSFLSSLAHQPRYMPIYILIGDRFRREEGRGLVTYLVIKETISCLLNLLIILACLWKTLLIYLLIMFC